jgi:hypothetical protein
MAPGPNVGQLLDLEPRFGDQIEVCSGGRTVPRAHRRELTVMEPAI